MGSTKITTSVSLDKENKQRAQEIFEELGIDNLSTAFNIFLAKTVKNDGFPFPLTRIDAIAEEDDEDENAPVFISEMGINHECSEWTSKFLRQFYRYHDENIDEAGAIELYAVLDAMFSFCSEMFESDSKYAQNILGTLNQDMLNMARSRLALPKNFNPIGKRISVSCGKSYVWSPYTSSIINIINYYCNMPELTFGGFEFVDWAAGFVSPAILNRATLSLRNGRTEVDEMDMDYHTACAMEEIRNIADRYITVHNWGFTDKHGLPYFPVYNKGEVYCK